MGFDFEGRREDAVDRRRVVMVGWWVGWCDVCDSSLQGNGKKRAKWESQCRSAGVQINIGLVPIRMIPVSSNELSSRREREESLFS